LRSITLRGHRGVVRLFFTRHPEAWEGGKLKQAVYEFMGEDIKSATYNIRRNYLTQFFNWCVREGIFPGKPACRIQEEKR